MTTPQGQVPPPPEGYPTWLDYALDPNRIARAELFALRERLADTKCELAALRKELSDAKAERDERTMRYWSAAEERDAARKELSDTHGLLAAARENLVAIDAQRAEAVRERDAAIAEDTDLLNAAHKAMHEANQELDALRAQVAELREAILELGELGCAYADGNELYLTDWNAQVAKLRAEPAPKAKARKAGRKQ